MVEVTWVEGEQPIRICPVRFVDIANASMICSNLVFKNIHLEYLIHVLYTPHIPIYRDYPFHPFTHPVPNAILKLSLKHMGCEHSLHLHKN